MILDTFSELNWLAILVAAVVWFGFSAAWYSVPPLSKAWQQAARVTPGDGTALVSLLVPTFIGYVLTTVTIALIARGIGATSFADGLSLGVVLGVGFGLVSALVTQLYEQKGASYWLINGINALIAYSVVAVIVTVWD